MSSDSSTNLFSTARFVLARLIATREARGLSQAAVADQMQIPVEVLARLEAGLLEHMPGDQVLSLCDVLDCDLESIVNPWHSWPVLDAHFKAGQQHERPLAEAFVKDLHNALDRGHLSARRAAREVGMDLGELARVFPAYGLESPFRL